MPLTLRPLALTTPRVRAELRATDPALTDAELARHYGLTPPIVRKWRQRDSTAGRSRRTETLHGTLTSAQ